jgi:hypothetical protein
MKYIVDIDGTICEQMLNFQYGEGKVFYDRILNLNKLYDDGNEIIYYTARGMGEFDGSYRLSNQKWYNITESQLKTWGAKYTKLIIGKYSGDYYIDDKAINSEEFFSSISKN